MNIKRFFRDQKDGVISNLRHVACDNIALTLCVLSWVALLCFFVARDGVFLGFLETVTAATVIGILGYNISLFFTKP